MISKINFSCKDPLALHADTAVLICVVPSW